MLKRLSTPERTGSEGAAADGKSQARTTSAPLHILLAEDNPVNQKVASALLERQGHQVVIARNGKDAVDLFGRDSFDLVLLDIQMPEMDANAGDGRLRSSRHHPLHGTSSGRRTPICALTAHAMKGDEERCLAAGMDGHLAKPIRTADLMRVVNPPPCRSHDLSPL